VVIQSFSSVFKHERRIRRIPYTEIDIPWPDGWPLRGVAYFSAAFLVVAFLGLFPVVSGFLGSLVTKFVVIPAAAAVLMYMANPDGRHAHDFLAHWIAWRWRQAPKRATLKSKGKVRVRWDSTAPELQKVILRGPQTVVFNEPVRFSLALLKTHGRVAKPCEDAFTGEYPIADGEQVMVKP
jgi:hypothetical protein